MVDSPDQRTALQTIFEKTELNRTNCHLLHIGNKNVQKKNQNYILMVNKEAIA